MRPAIEKADPREPRVDSRRARQGSRIEIGSGEDYAEQGQPEKERGLVRGEPRKRVREIVATRHRLVPYSR